MRGLIRRGGKLVVDEAVLPPPGQGQVICRTLACGICGSDLHAMDYYDHMIDAYERAGMGGSMKKGQDIIFGHEFCCEVLENGPGVEGKFKPGDHVVSVPGLMNNGGFVGLGFSNEYPGGFAEQLLLSEGLMLKVPNGLPPEQAALTEPLAVGEHAVAKAGLEGNEAIMVVGCGPVGLAVIASLKARGVGPIIASDYSAERRAAAERMGADKIVDPGEVSPHASWSEFGAPANRAEAMMLQMSGKTPRRAVIFECVGMPGVVQSLAQAAPAGAKIVVAGVCMETDRIEPLVLVGKETELRFVLGYTPDEFAASLRRLADGQTNYADIVTDVVGLEAAADAFVRLQTDKRQIKILVKPGE